MKKINVISHRGANIYAPQNTLPAFRKAAEIGVDGFETDIHLTKDGVPILCHNYTVDKTSNGTGKISQLTLKELKQLDFGGYFSPKFRGTRIPTLEEYLELVKESDIKILNIELKSPKENESNIVRVVMGMVKDFGLTDKLIISSFDADLLVQAKDLDQTVKTGLLYSPEKRCTYKNKLSSDPIPFAKQIGVDALHPMYNYVSEKYVDSAHENGFQVNTWTINSVKMIEKMIGWGVDGIITNFPDLVIGLINKHDC